MEWLNVFRFVGGLIIGSVLVAVIARLRQLMRIQAESEEEVEAYVEQIVAEEELRTSAQSDVEAAAELDKNYGGGGGA